HRPLTMGLADARPTLQNSSRNASVIQHELAAVEQRPEYVSEGFLLVSVGGVALDVFHKAIEFVGSRPAREGGEVKRFNLFGRRVEKWSVENGEQRQRLRWVPHLGRVCRIAGEVAVHQGQGLQDRRLIFRSLVTGVAELGDEFGARREVAVL